ncbi:hypothetical protein QYE76_064744 [Lolium multiflorum]|uniref:Uncharacterized protein n=1 Tax=Lolium multiflorum TaxID=4521 RepID=A0AAD8WA94_LOLMU|nr:hypothetical protein QYE76_064744 [Lolium multiflorum]
MENYSLLMGAAAVMKMVVEMAAVSMEEPSGALPRSGRVPEQRLLSPRSWLRDGGGSGTFLGRSVNLPSNEGRQHEASLQVIRRSLLDESRELIDHASKLRDVNAHLVNRAMKLWNEYAVLLNEHSSLSKENSSLSKENLSMVNQNGSLTKENISILKENSSLKKENISILKENSSLKKEHTYYKWRSMTGNK